jgi:NDP-sugar pyrophosphorylase family protein
MVLAAGLGERLRPLTERRAKPSLPLMNRPLILHVLDGLARGGVTKAVVNLHHRPESLEAVLAAGAPEGLAVETSFEPAILGTAGGLRAALGRFDAAEPILVVNADSLCDVDLGALAAAHAAARAGPGAAATLAVRARGRGDPYTPVHLDAGGRVCAIGGEGGPGPGEPVTFIGVHIVASEALGRIPEEGPSDLVRDVYLPILKEGGRLGAHRHDGWWIEVGSPRLYLEAHLRLLEEPSFLARLPAACGTPAPGPRPSLVGPACEGHGRARLQSAVLGPRCRLGDGCEIAGSVLGAGVALGRGCRVEGSVVAEGVELPAIAAVVNSLVLPPERPGGPARILPL